LVISNFFCTFAPDFESKGFFMSENIQKKILNVAAEKMRLLGIRSVSIDDICRDMGISKKTFYVYFSTKDDLVEAMLLQLEADVNANIQMQLQKKTILELLLNIQKIMREARDVRKVPPLFYDLEKYYPQQFKAHKDRTRTYARDNIKIALARGIEEHLFRHDLDVEKTCVVIDMMRETMMNLPIEKREEKKTNDVMKYAIDIVMRGIISEEGKRLIESRGKN